MECLPGRSLPKVSSLRRAACAPNCCAHSEPATASTATVRTALTLSQNGVNASFKIFLTFRPQFAALNRKCALDPIEPIHQLLDVLSRLCVIFPGVVGDGHPLAEGVLDRVIGRRKRIRCRTGCEDAAVAGEKMLEAQIGGEMAGGGGDAVIVLRAMARQHQRFRLALPFQRFDVEAPQFTA